MNKIISYISDEHFTKGKEYKCTDAYVQCENAMVKVADDHNNIVSIEINNSDFDFFFKHINLSIINEILFKKDEIIDRTQKYQELCVSAKDDQINGYNELYNYFNSNFNEEELMVIQSIMYFGRECYTGNEEEYKKTTIYGTISFWVKCLDFFSKDVVIGQMLGKTKLCTYFKCGFSVLEQIE